MNTEEILKELERLEKEDTQGYYTALLSGLLALFTFMVEKKDRKLWKYP